MRFLQDVFSEQRFVVSKIRQTDAAAKGGGGAFTHPCNLVGERYAAARDDGELAREYDCRVPTIWRVLRGPFGNEASAAA